MFINMLLVYDMDFIDENIMYVIIQFLLVGEVIKKMIMGDVGIRISKFN